MIITWNSDGANHYPQTGPVWNWSGPASGPSSTGGKIVCGTFSVTPRVDVTASVTPRVDGTPSVEEC